MYRQKMKKKMTVFLILWPPTSVSRVRVRKMVNTVTFHCNAEIKVTRTLSNHFILDNNFSSFSFSYFTSAASGTSN